MIRIALSQTNQWVGDIEGNVQRVARAIERARESGADLVAVPELAITGYPPDDLLLKRSFVTANVAALEHLALATREVVAVIGFVEPVADRLYNAAAICHEGVVVGVYRKHHLPNYGVFDEQRYFEPGDSHLLLDTDRGVIGVTVCEDLWEEDGPVVAQGRAGAQLVVNINASPFHKGKLAERTDLLSRRARQAGAAIAYVNSIGGQDELVFDGGSLVVDARGEVVARLPQFRESFAVVEVPLPEVSPVATATGVRREAIALRARVESPLPAPPQAERLEEPEEIYGALCLALSDYATKNGFEKVVLGLSGGVDSALTAAIAADALGADAVLGLILPSAISSSHSRSDAKEVAGALGIEIRELPIATIYDGYLEILDGVFGPQQPGLAEENLQARIRGNLWMFVSNRYGHLALVTGNKSEGACGYATLYGDMAGGFGVIKDLLKNEVYALCRYRNSLSPVIPETVLTKAPSAELREGQKDEDTLPPYDVLDPILEAYIERDASIDEIVQEGADRDIVEKVVAMVDRAEYKRRQAPPGPKVTTKAFGRDRRLPISNAWREGNATPVPPKVAGPQETPPGP
ncbi:MAG TPA: NAD+ synthase [Actinomycetota bacterium]|nr:NAD+ synthase [Actinomycetota bacterium]